MCFPAYSNHHLTLQPSHRVNRTEGGSRLAAWDRSLTRHGYSRHPRPSARARSRLRHACYHAERRHFVQDWEEANDRRKRLDHARPSARSRQPRRLNFICRLLRSSSRTTRISVPRLDHEARIQKTTSPVHAELNADTRNMNIIPSSDGGILRMRATSQATASKIQALVRRSPPPPVTGRVRAPLGKQGYANSPSPWMAWQPKTWRKEKYDNFILI